MLGAIVSDVRRRKGLSQRALARRAGTSQATISRIESGAESPSFERFERLLLVMGERPVVFTEALAVDVDPGSLVHTRAMTPEERLRESASWNLVATKLEIAGERARR